MERYVSKLSLKFLYAEFALADAHVTLCNDNINETEGTAAGGTLMITR